MYATFCIALLFALSVTTYMVHESTHVQRDIPGWAYAISGEQAQANKLAVNMAIYINVVSAMARANPSLTGSIPNSAVEMPAGYQYAVPWTNVIQRPYIVVYASAAVTPDISMEIARMEAPASDSPEGGLAGRLVRSGGAWISSPTLKGLTFLVTNMPDNVPAGVPVWATDVR